jgi:hypothetical protein
MLIVFEGWNNSNLNHIVDVKFEALYNFDTRKIYARLIMELQKEWAKLVSTHFKKFSTTWKSDKTFF